MMEGENTMEGKADRVYHREWRKQHPVAVSGEGAYLFDDSGRRVLDALGEVCVVNVDVGRGLQEAAEAMAAQARTVASP